MFTSCILHKGIALPDTRNGFHFEGISTLWGTVNAPQRAEALSLIDAKISQSPASGIFWRTLRYPWVGSLVSKKKFVDQLKADGFSVHPDPKTGVISYLIEKDELPAECFGSLTAYLEAGIFYADPGLISRSELLEELNMYNSGLSSHALRQIFQHLPVTSSLHCESNGNSETIFVVSDQTQILEIYASEICQGSRD